MAITNSHRFVTRGFLLRIILPTILTICLFVITLFFLLIPAFEKTILDRKREMIRELTNSAWSVLVELEAEEKAGKLSQSEAQQRAIDRIQFLRYGDESKDYFWISDMAPRMVVHPYRPELNGQSLLDYQDPTGKKLFIEFVNVIKEKQEGYVDYMWQWKDDETRIVPKLSFVKGFKPWGWIIGTGIYIEDVKEEIAKISQRLILISAAITALIIILLLFITQHSLMIEKQRKQAEHELRASREKYKTLVEASTEGFSMIVENKVFYANQTFLDMLGYQAGEFKGASIDCLMADDGTNNHYWKDFLENKPVPPKYLAQVLKKDGDMLDVLLSTSRISFAGQDAILIVAKDATYHQELEEELGDSKAKYEALTNNISMGVFRASLGKKGRLIEANPAAVSIFGFQDREGLFSTPLKELMHDEEDYVQFLLELNKNKSVKNKIVRIRRQDGTVPIVSISAVLIDDGRSPKYLDAILEDITSREKIDQERDDLIVELQTSLIYLNQPIRHSIREMLSCDMNQSIRRAATLMTKHNASAILVKSEQGDYLGVVTDHDIRSRVVAENYDQQKPVFEIMSSPLITISDHALIFEAALLMQQKRIRHLAIKDHSGEIISIITDKELLQVHRYSSAILLQELQKAESLDEIMEGCERLPLLVKALIDSGAKARNITRIITTISDVIIYKVINIAFDELGAPPASFAFIAMGSVGREEQTLTSDQDNAIIFEDVSADRIEEVQTYFLSFGKKVCTYLDQAGYDLCKGEVMAMNPKWCQPLAQWQDYFSEWITTADPQALLDLKIFFDYRFLFGDEELVESLTSHLHKVIEGKAAFFQNLASNTLLFKPPLGFFGNIVVKDKQGHPETFDIKDAMIPIVDFARTYALQKHIVETNTLDRLLRLSEMNVFTRSSYENAVQSYNLLMQLRFKHQSTALNQNIQPDNFINPKSLTNIELSMLKKTFSQISDFQSKLSFDFTGSG